MNCHTRRSFRLSKLLVPEGSGLPTIIRAMDLAAAIKNHFRSVMRLYELRVATSQ